MYSTLKSIHEKLLQRKENLVLAESCTSGMVAAELGQIPGISGCFCGSMVVYQTQSKVSWLGLNAQFLADPGVGPVSNWASRELADKLLKATPHASISAAITGHLGPGAPVELDGKVYFASQIRVSGLQISHEILLESPSPRDTNDSLARLNRQREATQSFLRWIDDIVLIS